MEDNNNNGPNTDIPYEAFANIGRSLSQTDDFSKTYDLKNVNENLLEELKECKIRLKRFMQIYTEQKNYLDYILKETGLDKQKYLTRSVLPKFTKNGGTKKRKPNKRRRYKSRIYRH